MSDGPFRDLFCGSCPADWERKAIPTGYGLRVARGVNSNSVDLIHIDPRLSSNRNYATPIGLGDADVELSKDFVLSARRFSEPGQFRKGFVTDEEYWT